MDDLKDKSEEEQIGFHKGSLSTLSKEREELSRILNIVEQLMQMHVESLKELGVDLEEEAENIKDDQGKEDSGDSKPIEDLL